MERLLNNVEHWRSRAEEARTIAELMNDAECRRMMLRIADDYEKIAKKAKEHKV